MPLWALDRLGIHPPAEQREAFIAFWRHLGFYIGVQPDTLTKYFCNVPVADQFLASMLLHLCSESVNEESQPGMNMTTGIVAATFRSFPSFPPLSWHLGTVHFFLGDGISDARGVPTPSFATKLAVRAAGFLLSFPVRFGYAYPRRGWLRTRRALIREALIDLLQWSSALRQSAQCPFTLGTTKSEAAEAEKMGGHVHGQNFATHATAAAATFPWRRLLWKSFVLHLEMVVVVCAAVLVPVLAVWFLLVQRRW